jgi:hypothetical protein
MPVGYTKIYHLRVPDGYPRYVGKTIHSLENRLARHYKESVKGNHRRANWIRKQQRGGVPIIIELIEEVPGDGSDRERYWIAEYKRRGYDLVNATEGGEGVIGLVYSEQSRVKMSVSHSRVMSDPKRKEISRRTALRQWENRTAEERSAWSKKLNEAYRNKHPKKEKKTMSEEEKHANRSLAVRSMHARRTPEQKAEIAKKGAATRAANEAKKKAAGIPKAPVKCDRELSSQRAKLQWALYTPERRAEICSKISKSRSAVRVSNNPENRKD